MPEPEAPTITPEAPKPEAPLTPPAAPESEFKPITSQEDLNRVLSDRLNREKQKYSDYAELKAAAERLQAIEDAQRTDAEKAAAAAAKRERELEEARSETLRYKVAAAHKVGEDYFDLLGSGDEETLNGRGERLSALIVAKEENELLKQQIAALQQGKPAPSQLRPVASLKPGATPQDQPSEDDVLYRSLFGDS